MRRLPGKIALHGKIGASEIFLEGTMGEGIHPGHPLQEKPGAACMTSITWCAQSASVRVQFDERLLQLQAPDIRHRLRVCCPTLAVRVEGELPQGALRSTSVRPALVSRPRKRGASPTSLALTCSQRHSRMSTVSS